MLVSQIFKGFGSGRHKTPRDAKYTQCERIENIDTPPFVKRCTNHKGEGLKVCLPHAFTVNYKFGADVERTKYFSTRNGAEQFRKREVSDCWTETNYSVGKTKPPVAKESRSAR